MSNGSTTLSLGHLALDDLGFFFELVALVFYEVFQVVHFRFPNYLVRIVAELEV